jgi:hypothetical protein
LTGTEIAGTRNPRRKARYSGSPGGIKIINRAAPGCGQRTGVHSRPAPARYVSRSCAVAPQTTRQGRRTIAAFIQIGPVHIAGNMFRVLAGVPGPWFGPSSGRGATDHELIPGQFPVVRNEE